MLLFLFGFLLFLPIFFFSSYNKNSRIHGNDFAIKIYKSFTYILEINLKMSKIYKTKKKQKWEKKSE